MAMGETQSPSHSRVTLSKIFLFLYFGIVKMFLLLIFKFAIFISFWPKSHRPYEKSASWCSTCSFLQSLLIICIKQSFESVVCVSLPMQHAGSRHVVRRRPRKGVRPFLFLFRRTSVLSMDYYNGQRLSSTSSPFRGPGHDKCFV